MMTAGGNADGKLSEEMEGEEVLRKVECLRGRLLAERAASRNAKEEAEIMEIKLIELETRLKEETRSRNRAEKRLKFLLKKVESLEIFYVSDESEQSSFVDKSEISSVASTSAKGVQDKEVNTNPESCDAPAGDVKQNVSQISASSSQTHGSPAGDEDEINSYETEELREIPISPDKDSLNCTIKEEKILMGGGDDCVDNTMAIVPMDLPKKTEQTIDPAVLDSTVKDVLGALRNAKGKLQTSMERRRMIRVG